jgi:Mor family transcriptional regulator
MPDSTTHTHPLRKKHPLERAQRNKKLYEDYCNGMNQVQLVSKYRITPGRIYQIINREIEKEADGSRSTT